MQSKISCFNQTIFKKNLTRFWPFAVLYGVYLILVHPLMLYVQLSGGTSMHGNSDDYWNYVASHFMSMTEPVSICLFAIIMAMAVFGYLYQSRNTNMLHAFPVTRRELYVTNFVSAMALMLIPQLLTALVMNLVMLGKANGLIWVVWAWFGISACETVFFLGLAVFSVMLTGQLLPAAVFYMMWNLLYVVVVGLIDGIADLFVFGLGGTLIELRSHVLFPLAYMLRYIGFGIVTEGEVKSFQPEGIGALLAYAFVGLLLAAAAYYAYRKRALECAGDFLSFSFTRPVFRWELAMLGGTAASLFVTAILTDGRGTQSHAAMLFFIWMIVFSAVLFFVAEMFVERSFRVFKKRIAVECVSCIAVLLIGVALLRFDVFGIESYVPEISEVSMAQLSGDGWACFDSEADLEKIVELHKMIVDQAQEQKKLQNQGMWEDVFCYYYIGFDYVLNNGNHVSRSYNVAITDEEYGDELWERFAELMYDREAIKRAYLGMNYDELDWKVTSVSLDYSSARTDFNSTYVPVFGTEEELQRFYEAALCDIEAGAFTWPANGEMDDDMTAMDALLTIRLQTDRLKNEIRVAGSAYLELFDRDETGTEAVIYLSLNSDCTHLIEVLVDMSVIDGTGDLSLNE